MYHYLWRKYEWFTKICTRELARNRENNSDSPKFSPISSKSNSVSYMYAGSEFKIERQLWETRAAPRPTYLWSGTCPLQLRAYTQIPSCRRISSGLIAQVALLPFRGGGPLSPRGQHPILGPRKYSSYCKHYYEVQWWWWTHWAGIRGWRV